MLPSPNLGPLALASRCLADPATPTGGSLEQSVGRVVCAARVAIATLPPRLVHTGACLRVGNFNGKGIEIAV